MSAELNTKIDATRNKLISAANTPISYGNYKQVKRTFEEILLAITNAIDELNAALDKEIAEGDK